MIPEHTQSGVLPPFLNAQGPTRSSDMSPYKTSMSEVIKRYAFTDERIAILKGLLDYRSRLREIGVVNGFQWFDGSFVEDVENTRKRPPSDVDIVTFAYRPTIDATKWRGLIDENKVLFDSKQSKEEFSCDAYYVDLNVPAQHIVNQTRFWFGLFSHQKSTYLWKGMLEVPLNSDDDIALQLLNKGVSNAD